MQESYTNLTSFVKYDKNINHYNDLLFTRIPKSLVQNTELKAFHYLLLSRINHFRKKDHPTQEELAWCLGVSKDSVKRGLSHLQKTGHIEYVWKKGKYNPKSIKVIDTDCFTETFWKLPNCILEIDVLTPTAKMLYAAIYTQFLYTGVCDFGTKFIQKTLRLSKDATFNAIKQLKTSTLLEIADELSDNGTNVYFPKLPTYLNIRFFTHNKVHQMFYCEKNDENPSKKRPKKAARVSAKTDKQIARVSAKADTRVSAKTDISRLAYFVCSIIDFKIIDSFYFIKSTFFSKTLFKKLSNPSTFQLKEEPMSPQRKRNRKISCFIQNNVNPCSIQDEQISTRKRELSCSSVNQTISKTASKTHETIINESSHVSFAEIDSSTVSDAFSTTSEKTSIRERMRMKKELKALSSKSKKPKSIPHETKANKELILFWNKQKNLRTIQITGTKTYKQSLYYLQAMQDGSLSKLIDPKVLEDYQIPLEFLDKHWRHLDIILAIKNLSLRCLPTNLPKHSDWISKLSPAEAIISPIYGSSLLDAFHHGVKPVFNPTENMTDDQKVAFQSMEKYFLRLKKMDALTRFDLQKIQNWTIHCSSTIPYKVSLLADLLITALKEKHDDNLSDHLYNTIGLQIVPNMSADALLPSKTIFEKIREAYKHVEGFDILKQAFLYSPDYYIPKRSKSEQIWMDIQKEIRMRELEEETNNEHIVDLVTETGEHYGWEIQDSSTRKQKEIIKKNCTTIDYIDAFGNITRQVALC